MSDLSQEAKYLMNNPAFQSALSEARRQALAAAMGCDAKDDEGRRRYLDAVRTVDKVSGHIVALMQSEALPDDKTVTFYEDQAQSRYSKFMDALKG